jgi:Heavy metal associated domain 2
MAQSAAQPKPQPYHIFKLIWEAILGVWNGLRGKSISQRVTNRQTASHPPVAYSVAHAIPGRVRFHVPRLSDDEEYAHRLQMLAQSDISITEVRINRNAASVVFNYEPSALSEAEKRFPKIPIPLASPKEIGFSHLVSLIQFASQANRKNCLTWRYTSDGEIRRWRDGKIFPAVQSSQLKKKLFNSKLSRATQKSLTSHPPLVKFTILACSLEVRKAEISSSCCLLKSKVGKPLAGGAKAARIHKLRRLSVLI